MMSQAIKHYLCTRNHLILKLFDTKCVDGTESPTRAPTLLLTDIKFASQSRRPLLRCDVLLYCVASIHKINE